MFESDEPQFVNTKLRKVIGYIFTNARDEVCCVYTCNIVIFCVLFLSNKLFISNYSVKTL